MYAIVDIAGQQFKVEKDQKIFVNRLNIEAGKTINFDKVLLLDNNGKVDVGQPIVKGVSIVAKVLDHIKGDKVIVFKKKRRKGYKVKNGFRASLTSIEIKKIELNSTKKTVKVSSETKSAVKKPSKETSSKETSSKETSSKETSSKETSSKETSSKETSRKKIVNISTLYFIK